jgi:hypothetical protein
MFGMGVGDGVGVGGEVGTGVGVGVATITGLDIGCTGIAWVNVNPAAIRVNSASTVNNAKTNCFLKFQPYIMQRLFFPIKGFLFRFLDKAEFTFLD